MKLNLAAAARGHDTPANTPQQQTTTQQTKLLQLKQQTTTLANTPQQQTATQKTKLIQKKGKINWYLIAQNF